MQRNYLPTFWVVAALAIGLTVLLTGCRSNDQPNGAAGSDGDLPGTVAASSAAAQDSHTHNGNSSHQSGAQDNGGAVPDDAVVIDFAIVERGTQLTRSDLKVDRGDTVILNFTADEPGEIHLHGYDLTVGVSPNRVSSLTFPADIAGAFGINFHVYASEPGDTNGHDQETANGYRTTALEENHDAESADSQQGGHNHDHDSPAILAEVHLGNLEVYP